MYKSEFHNAKETMEILKKCSPDDLFRVYHKKKKGPIPHSGDDMTRKPTLSQRLDELTRIVVDGFKRVDTRIDNLENRIDKIEARLDYYGLQIEQINKRLDYNGLQIEQINKRLDYNGLKQLPNKR